MLNAGQHASHERRNSVVAKGTPEYYWWKDPAFIGRSTSIKISEKRSEKNVIFKYAGKEPNKQKREREREKKKDV